MADYKGRIGNLIRDARKHRGLTQHQLAELLGTSQMQVSRLLTKTLAHIRQILDIDLSSVA